MPMKTAGLFGWLFIVSFATTQTFAIEQPFDEVKYHDLASYVRTYRSDVAAMDYDIERALQNENIILSGLFPKFFINGIKEQQTGDFWPNAQITLSITQSLYEPAGPLTKWLLAKTQTELLRWSKENLLDDAQYEVGKNFLSYRNVLLKNASVTALDASSRDQFTKAEKSYAEGLISAVEFEQEKAAYEYSQSKVLSYQNEVSVAREGLEFASEQPITGKTKKVDSEMLYKLLLKGSEDFTPHDFVMEALACRKELKVIDQQISEATIKKDLARYAYIPTIKFVADIARVWGAPIYEGPHVYRFGLSFDWNLDLENLFNFRAADATKLKIVFDRKRMEFTIENEIKTDCDQLEIVTKEVVATKEKTEAARITFEQNQKEYEIGMLSEVDFKKAQTDWEQAQFELENTITKAGQKHEELLWATGYPKTQTSCFFLVEKSQ